MKMLWDLLTNREAQIARLLLEAKSRDEIARDLGISLGTVKYHMRLIALRVGVSENPLFDTRVRIVAALLYDLHPELRV